MPTMVKVATFVAAGTNANINAGSVFETCRQRSALSMAVVQSVTANFALINVGADVVAEEFEPMVLTTVPIVPDHFMFTDIGEPNDKVVIALRATVAVTFRAVTIIGGA